LNFTGIAVRVSINPLFFKKSLNSEFVRLRKKGVAPQDIKPRIVAPLIDNIMKQADEVLFKISDVFDYEFKGKKGTFEWHECQNCGEIVFASGIRIKDSKRVCIPCSGYG